MKVGSKLRERGVCLSFDGTGPRRFFFFKKMLEHFSKTNFVEKKMLFFVNIFLFYEPLNTSSFFCRHFLLAIYLDFFTRNNYFKLFIAVRVHSKDHKMPFNNLAEKRHVAKEHKVPI